MSFEVSILLPGITVTALPRAKRLLNDFELYVGVKKFIRICEFFRFIVCDFYAKVYDYKKYIDIYTYVRMYVCIYMYFTYVCMYCKCDDFYLRLNCKTDILLYSLYIY